MTATKRLCVLKFVAGKYESAEFPVAASPTRIGRDTELEMVLYDDAVSAHHARISIDGDAFWIEDLGSENGTFVNGARIERVALAPGDRIVISEHEMHVVMSAE